LGIADHTSAGSSDFFIVKLDQGGNYIWSTRRGGSSNDYCNAIAVDEDDNIFTTGRFEGTVGFSNPGNNLTSAGSSDVFILKLDSEAGFVWAKRLGGDSY